MKKFVLLALLASSLAACSGSTLTPATTGERTIAVQTSETPAFETQLVNGVAWAVPKGMDLNTYPVYPWKKGRRVDREYARSRGLHQITLPAGTVIWNEDPERRAFWLDTLRKDRLAWANDKGELVYIDDCANRAMVPQPLPSCPTSVTCPGPHLANTGGGTAIDGASKLAPTSSALTTGGGDGYNVPGWLKSLWYGLGTLALFLLALFLLALLLAGAYVVGRAIMDWVRNRGGNPAPAPVPVAMPVRGRRQFGPRPVVAGAPAPVPVPPAPAAQFHRFGPFDSIAIDDAGAEGYRVTGFPAEGGEVLLGTFRWAQTENAGAAGEYVTVML